MERIKELIVENRVAILIGVCVLLFFCWLHTDKHRNDGINNNTDNTMERIDERISGIERRLDTMSKRLEQTQKTISGVAERVDRSTENAQAIAGGLQSAETRLDDAIQRSGRIENLISEIERTNK